MEHGTKTKADTDKNWGVIESDVSQFVCARGCHQPPVAKADMKEIPSITIAPT